jgi:hypothetical protein
LISDPCRLVRQVKEFAASSASGAKLFLLFFDPCRLVRQVKEFSS